MRALLISTYDLGRQPVGLASPAAWLRRDGVHVECADVSRDPLGDDAIRAADLVAFFLPMHTATRLAAPLIDRVRALNPSARLAAFGLYAPLNADWLRGRGVAHVLGPDAEAELAALAAAPAGLAPAGPRSAGSPAGKAGGTRRLPVLLPDRTSLPPLSRYAALQMPDGSRRVAGATDASRGCKHRCRHCPIVPVYDGRFRAVPIDVVIEDVRAQVAAGAEHISFGDADFFNGPTHARRLVQRLATAFPNLTYDATIKIEHLLRHRDLLPELRETGCLLVTSAVESVDDAVLARLRKGHTRADVVTAVGLCREAGLALAPTFVPFTPWTTVEGYRELLSVIEQLGLVQAVAPIQLAIRLLVTAQSRLLELPEIRDLVEPFDGESLSYPWRHPDPRVDELQRDVMRLVGERPQAGRADVFARVAARAGAGRTPPLQASMAAAGPPPYLTEGWYCCAEPGPEQIDLV